MESRKGCNKVGWRYGVMCGLFLVAGIVYSLIYHKLFTVEQQEAYKVNASFIATIIIVDMICFPVIYFLCKKLQKAEIKKQTLGAKKFILGITYCAAFVVIGAILGAIVNVVFGYMLTGEISNNTAVAELMLNSGFFMRVLSVGILAPIFEELIFRKVLVDHLAPYGKKLAIVTSGLLFGLFHGNFAQFFFATFLGWFFAYVYVSTGKIRYTIFYHMIINCSTSIVTMALIGPIMKLSEDADLAVAIAADPSIVVPALLFFIWMGGIFVTAIVGLILFILNMKKMTVVEDGQKPSVGASFASIFSSWGMWIFIAICIFMILDNYLGWL